MSASTGLAVRSLRNLRRLPSAFLPALLMPVFQVVSFSGTYAGVTEIPGFPTDRSVNWYLPMAVAMGASQVSQARVSRSGGSPAPAAPAGPPPPRWPWGGSCPREA